MCGKFFVAVMILCSLSTIETIVLKKVCPIDKEPCSWTADLQYKCSKDYQCPEEYKCCFDCNYGHNICRKFAFEDSYNFYICPHVSPKCMEGFSILLMKKIQCDSNADCDVGAVCCPHSCVDWKVCQTASGVDWVESKSLPTHKDESVAEEYNTGIYPQTEYFSGNDYVDNTENSPVAEEYNTQPNDGYNYPETNYQTGESYAEASVNNAKNILEVKEEPAEYAFVRKSEETAIVNETNSTPMCPNETIVCESIGSNFDLRCFSDYNCEDGYKCCYDACYRHRVCVRPVKKKPLQVNSGNKDETTHESSDNNENSDYFFETYDYGRSNEYDDPMDVDYSDTGDIVPRTTIAADAETVTATDLEVSGFTDSTSVKTTAEVTTEIRSTSTTVQPGLLEGSTTDDEDNDDDNDDEDRYSGSGISTTEPTEEITEATTHRAVITEGSVFTYETTKTAEVTETIEGSTETDIDDSDELEYYTTERNVPAEILNTTPSIPVTSEGFVLTDSVTEITKNPTTVDVSTKASDGDEYDDNETGSGSELGHSTTEHDVPTDEIMKTTVHFLSKTSDFVFTDAVTEIPEKSTTEILKTTPLIPVTTETFLFTNKPSEIDENPTTVDVSTKSNDNDDSDYDDNETGSGSGLGQYTTEKILKTTSSIPVTTETFLFTNKPSEIDENPTTVDVSTKSSDNDDDDYDDNETGSGSGLGHSTAERNVSTEEIMKTTFHFSSTTSGFLFTDVLTEMPEKSTSVDMSTKASDNDDDYEDYETGSGSILGQFTAEHNILTKEIIKTTEIPIFISERGSTPVTEEEGSGNTDRSPNFATDYDNQFSSGDNEYSSSIESSYNLSEEFIRNEAR